MQTLLFLLCLLHSLNPTYPIYASICDCNNMKIRGILDFELPYYCDNEKPETQHLPRIPTSYTLVTKQKPAATWKGWTCRQWTKTKKITGSFWIGSFDTVYSKETILITPLECWRMVNDKKCGNNNMQTGPTGLSFTATPTGEGKWYAIKEYQTLNCVAEQITLRQEKPDSPIESPFGLLNTTQQEGQFIQNQNTIVWGERTTNSSYTQTLLKGKGYLELPREPESDNSSRLYDTSRQIEISFLNKPDKDIAPVGHKVVGIPLTYLTFPAETTKILYEMFKNTIATCLKNTNLATPVCEDYRELYKSRPQRSLLQEVHFLFDTQVEDEQLGIRLYSISYAWGTLRLAHRRPKIIKEDGKIVQKDTTIYITYESGSRNPLTTYSQLSKDDPLPSGSKFEYIVDQTIRVQNTHICITETTHDYVFAAACSEESTRWILEKENSYLISQESEMCLTVGVDETLKLEKCALEGDTRKNQQWFFQTINTNPDVIENFPDVTLQDIQEVRLEQRRAITTTINSPIFGGILKANHGSGNIIWDMIAWGLLKNGQYANGKCVTHHGLEQQLTMEDCDTDWTKCQEELKTFITSNDPLVQSQVSVGNCSRATTKGQAFEYTSDFTIRPFNTNACVKANTTMLILQECANTSSIWGTFEHTGQLMATDRTGLHSPASDRKCLTLKVGRLSLGHCHGSSRKQKFNFEYRNPHQIRTLSAAAIIALHTQQSLDGTQLPFIPPLLKREITEIGFRVEMFSPINFNKTRSAISAVLNTAKKFRRGNQFHTTTTVKPTTKLSTTTIKTTIATTAIKTTVKSTPPTTRPTTTTKPTTTTTKPTTTTTKPTTTTTKPTTTTTKPTTTTNKPTTTTTTPTTTTTKSTTTTTTPTTTTTKSTTTTTTPTTTTTKSKTTTTTTTTTKPTTTTNKPTTTTTTATTTTAEPTTTTTRPTTPSTEPTLPSTTTETTSTTQSSTTTIATTTTESISNSTTPQ
ncbi:hypothetical protein OUZ56_030055 [Daphnia magna]|uniref:Ricin B lectin domain-containing protein n=1 Tax=Daphnia magna TaxID=35525 RepID=A0ABQ9ZQ64_9CRUS|nr:hypothetical protein OUZ56_030055 [Daphnia magna]